MCGDEPWAATADALDERTLRQLMQGLVLFSRASNWSGGSVSPVIVLFRRYQERFSGSAIEIAEWILENRQNPNEPYGYHVPLGIHGMNEMRSWQQRRGQAAARRYERETLRQKLATVRRADRATQLLPNAVRRGDLSAVVALLARGADPEHATVAGESLIELAEAHGRVAVAKLLRDLQARRSDLAPPPHSLP
jgi:hypothetical protein